MRITTGNHCVGSYIRVLRNVYVLTNTLDFV